MKITVTDEIHLSEIRPADKDAIVAHLQDKAIYDRTLRIPYPYTESDADNWLALVAKITQQQGQPVHLAIRNAQALLIGAVGFDEFQIGQSHRAEIGYWLARPCWGRGIMTAVVRQACKFAFREWSLTKITAHVFAFNAPSARVLEKCGFRQEGFLREHYRKGDQLIDARVYGLFRSGGE